MYGMAVSHTNHTVVWRVRGCKSGSQHTMYLGTSCAFKLCSDAPTERAGWRVRARAESSFTEEARGRARCLMVRHGRRGARGDRSATTGFASRGAPPHHRRVHGARNAHANGGLCSIRTRARAAWWAAREGGISTGGEWCENKRQWRRRHRQEFSDSRRAAAPPSSVQRNERALEKSTAHKMNSRTSEVVGGAKRTSVKQQKTRRRDGACEAASSFASRDAPPHR